MNWYEMERIVAQWLTDNHRPFVQNWLSRTLILVANPIAS